MSSTERKQPSPPKLKVIYLHNLAFSLYSRHKRFITSGSKEETDEVYVHA